MKKIVFTFATLVAAASVHASYLYWQINGNEPALTNEELSAPANYTGVRIFASDDNGATKKFLNLGYANYDTEEFTSIGYAVDAPVGGMLLADVSGIGEGYSFYVELINNNVSTWKTTNTSAYPSSDFAGQLQGNDETYANLVQKGFIGADLSPVSMAVWHGGSQYSAVPEPTSAVLMLIGMAGLALRRRRAV